MRSTSLFRLAVTGAILVVLLNAWVAFHAVNSLFNADRWLAHTLQVLRVADDTLLQYTTANSSARAYLLTSDPLFEKRYVDARGAMGTGIESLFSLTADNTSQQARLSLLRSRIALKMGNINTAIALRGRQPQGALDTAVLQPALRDSPDGGVTIRYVLTQITGEEDRLLKQRTDATRSARVRVITTLSGATLLDVLLLLLAFRLLTRTVKSRQELAERANEITELNRELIALNTDLENRVEQRTRELEVSNRELEAFSYSVSHDLRAPLRTIDGFSLALQEDFTERLNDEGRDYINRVRGGVQRMGTLIDALLQLSRVTRSEVVRERVDVTQLATSVFRELQAGDPGRKVEWEAQEGVVTEADARLLRIALENLVGNAWKFTARVPEAHISFGSSEHGGSGEHGEGTVYFVRDNGAGFDMKYVDRLFTAFQRLHGDREFKGSGIGLATVSRIIRRHHGEIWAEGAVGRGATFSFTLTSAASPELDGTSYQEAATV